MEIPVDLHSHSMFAGGSGGLSTSVATIQDTMKKAHKRFLEAEKNSVLKGIKVLGSGDIQFTPWLDFFKKDFEEESGLFYFKEGTGELRYCLQTEVILTAEMTKKKRKSVHTLLLFPNFETIDEFKSLLATLGVKQEKLARPFIVLENSIAVSDFLFNTQEIDSEIEIIPAHIMTPEGVYGGNDGVNQLETFFGSFSKELKVFETGLSADPEILSIIPELDNKTFLSNSDAHSAQLHRIGREFTTLNMNNLNYQNIIDSLRKQNIAYTLEFPVSEGRFFLTGHRASRKKPGAHNKDQYCFFSPEHVPKDNICPICHAELTKGVLQRVFEICRDQHEDRQLKNNFPKQKFLHGVPLIEVISTALNLKSPDAKSSMKNYKAIIDVFGTEVQLWRSEGDYVMSNMPKNLPAEIVQAISTIKQENFSFFPLGFDGTYGQLVLGKKQEYFGHSVITR